MVVKIINNAGLVLFYGQDFTNIHKNIDRVSTVEAQSLPKNGTFYPDLRIQSAVVFKLFLKAYDRIKNATNSSKMSF